jgi:hypothetical protein
MNSADDSLPKDCLGVAHDRMFSAGFNRKSREIELAIKSVTENGQAKKTSGLVPDQKRTKRQCLARRREADSVLRGCDFGGTQRSPRQRGSQ